MPLFPLFLFFLPLVLPLTDGVFGRGVEADGINKERRGF